MVDDRTRVSREVIEALHSSDLPVFGTTIPYRSGAEDQVAERLVIGDPGMNPGIGRAYQLLTGEVVRRTGVERGRLGTERYEKTSAFVTPEQRQWLRTTARGLPEGLSASDLVRLALDQLQEAVDNGFGLVQALTERAHLDAQQRFEGRRNRGLPRRPVD
jgi:hypothetical protein